MSELIKGLEEYFEETPKEQLEQELKDLEKYNLPIDNYTRAPFDKLP